jgi:hypothetical protein
METTITTCDRCGKTEKEDTASWSQLWVNDEQRHTTIDLCDQCAKALLGWVQSGVPVATGPTT